jgi:hypothetical protein
MPPLASFLLAALLGQASISEPPPCVAANVPGCLAGYYAKIDALGRIVYIRDPNYVPPMARAAPARLAPAHSEVVFATQRVAPDPAPQYAPAQPASWAYPLAPRALNPVRAERVAETRGHVALVFMPGVSTYPTYTRFSQGKGEGQIALELRGGSGGGRVRLAAEYASFGKMGELSFKYDLFDRFFFRPFLAVGVGVASINPDPKLRAAGSGSAGLDLYLSRDFFLTGEVKRRFFMAGTQGEAHGLVVAREKQTALLAGMGFYFF